MSRSSNALVLALTGLLAGAGCSYQEGLVIEDLTGTVVIPGEFISSGQVVDGVPTQVPDPKLIGPVYLGLYAGSVEANVTTSYPYVSTGPVFDTENTVGDAYPYGGTSIGMLRSTCLEALQCKVATGRFVDYDELLEYVSQYGEVVDFVGDPITTGDDLKNTCMAALDYVEDYQLGLVAVDENGDEVVDENDLDFVLREDGNYEAEFNIWQQEYFEGVPYGAGPDAETQGFTLWGFMDAPAAGDGTFSTCDTSGRNGENPESYSQPVYNMFAMSRDILNRPNNYIRVGDVVSGVQDQAGGNGDIGYIFHDPDETPELWLNFQVEQ